MVSNVCQWCLQIQIAVYFNKLRAKKKNKFQCMEGACQYLPLLNVCLLAPIFASCHQWASSFVSLQPLFGLAPIDTHHLFLPFFLFLLSLLFFNSFPPLSLSLSLQSFSSFFFASLSSQQHERIMPQRTKSVSVKFPFRPSRDVWAAVNKRWVPNALISFCS